MKKSHRQVPPPGRGGPQHQGQFRVHCCDVGSLQWTSWHRPVPACCRGCQVAGGRIGGIGGYITRIYDSSVNQKVWQWFDMNSKNVNFCNLLVLLHVKLLVTIRMLNFPDHYSCSPWAGGGWRTNQLFAVRELPEIENFSFLVRLRSASANWLRQQWISSSSGSAPGRGWAGTWRPPTSPLSLSYLLWIGGK